PSLKCPVCEAFNLSFRPARHDRRQAKIEADREDAERNRLAGLLLLEDDRLHPAGSAAAESRRPSDRSIACRRLGALPATRLLNQREIGHACSLKFHGNAVIRRSRLQPGAHRSAERGLFSSIFEVHVSLSDSDSGSLALRLVLPFEPADDALLPSPGAAEHERQVAGATIKEETVQCPCKAGTPVDMDIFLCRMIERL